MPERASIYERTQIGKEANAAYGTPVAATIALAGTSIEPTIEGENSEQRSKGSRWVNSVTQNKQWTSAKVMSDVAQYPDNAYLNSMILGSPAITTPGGGSTSRNHNWTAPTWSALSPMPFTVENGSAARAMKFPYGLLTGMGMTYDRKSGVKVTGDMIGWATTDGATLTPGTNEVQTQAKTGTVSSGTFTLTWKGETTAAIAYDASAATIQTAFLLLPNLDSGDVVVTGGPAGTADVIFTFGGRYASIDVPLIVCSSGSLSGGGTYDITETTPGAALTELALQPISGDEWSLAIDTSAAGLGGSVLTRVLSCSWNIADLYGPVWVGNPANTSWVTHTDLAPKTEIKWKVEADASGMAYKTQWETGDSVFTRFLCTGPIIEGSIPYKDQRDFCAKIMKVSPFEDADGIYAIEYTASIAHDKTWAKALDWNSVTTLTAIS